MPLFDPFIIVGNIHYFIHYFIHSFILSVLAPCGDVCATSVNWSTKRTVSSCYGRAQLGSFAFSRPSAQFSFLLLRYSQRWLQSAIQKNRWVGNCPNGLMHRKCGYGLQKLENVRRVNFYRWLQHLIMLFICAPHTHGRAHATYSYLILF